MAEENTDSVEVNASNQGSIAIENSTSISPNAERGLSPNMVAIGVPETPTTLASRLSNWYNRVTTQLHQIDPLMWAVRGVVFSYTWLNEKFKRLPLAAQFFGSIVLLAAFIVLPSLFVNGRWEIAVTNFLNFFISAFLFSFVILSCKNILLHYQRR